MPTTVTSREAGVDLQPFNSSHEQLFQKVGQHLNILARKAEEYQAILNAEHRSEFNPFLLFEDGLQYSERCDADGTPQETGAFVRGVCVRMESSVDPHHDYFTIDYVDGNGGEQLIAHFGRRHGSSQTGIRVDTRHPFNEYRLSKQISNAYRKAGFEHEIVERATPTDGILKVWKICDSIDQAIDAMNQIVGEYLGRLSLEAKFCNLFRSRPNMTEIHDGNLEDFIVVKDREKDSYPERVLLITTARVCRRCRAEFEELFIDFTGRHPEIQFGIAFTDKPQNVFFPIVFEDHCGGVRTSGYVTPFIIPYRNGQYCGRYLATGKIDPPPSIESIDAMIGEFFQ